MEANCLISAIRKSDFVTLHTYGPRQNRGFSPLDHLMLYNVPENARHIGVPDVLRTQLNLFSGQLYLESYVDYKNLCEFLGVASTKTPEGLVVAADGFIKQGSAGAKSTFRESPLKFLAMLMSQIRKDCQEIGRTHIGRLLSGQLLNVSDFSVTEPLTTELAFQSLKR
ncbi:hypothetical protein N7495_004941 [Penicillium taxi]|uniref:uncharacterized protein n=1 Tax=Penicillium taxi TaxID=168475 RepID=UPI002544F013|nr:uncharacterized protein N7495_004941 [Penicillium taxi]KAJ5893250.1 hypothetical protein N7495_004941 [Penicillium taxi]